MHQLQLTLCQKKKKLPVLWSKIEGPGNTLAVLTVRKTNHVTAGAWETYYDFLGWPNEWM